jgi:DNA-binding FrmR family transcriptional regulator
MGFVVYALNPKDPCFTDDCHSPVTQSRLAVYCTPVYLLTETAMPNTIQDKKRLLTRVRRIKGQVEALEGALAQKSASAAILQQIAAIRGAVNGLMSEVLAGHLREHVAADIPVRQRQQDVEQVVQVLRSYLK